MKWCQKHLLAVGHAQKHHFFFLWVGKGVSWFAKEWHMWYIPLTSVQICALSRQRKIRKVSLNDFWAYPQSLALCLFNGCMRIFQFFPILKVFHFVNPHKPVFCMEKENSHYFKIWLQVLIIEIEIKITISKLRITIVLWQNVSNHTFINKEHSHPFGIQKKNAQIKIIIENFLTCCERVHSFPTNRKT